MKIAWFTPFNPQSAIGHYSEAAVRELVKTDDVVVYASDSPRATDVGPAPVVALTDDRFDAVLRDLKGFDAAVYNMGNHAPYHKRIYEVLLHHPGVVVLHDLVLRDFFFGYLMGEKRAPLVLARQMAYGEGPDGEAMAHDFLSGRHTETANDPRRLRFPMFRSAVHRCEGVIVHSEYSRARVAAAVAAPVAKFDFPQFGPAAVRPAPAPRPARPGRVRLLTFGYLNPNKLIHMVIASIAASDYLRAHAEYLIVGQPDESYVGPLRETVARLGLSDAVRLTGWLSDDDLWRELTTADVVVNLRNPHMGESSASLLDALFAEAATVVWNHGYYAEFPDDVVCKVASEDELTQALERLCGDRGLRESLGRNARRHALARFDTAAYCQRFRDFLGEVRSVRPILSLTDLLSDRLLEFGTRPPDGLPERLAAEIAALTGDYSDAPALIRIAA